MAWLGEIARYVLGCPISSPTILKIWVPGDVGNDKGFKPKISGQINARVKLKTEQTRISDAQGLPAYIIVVEFSRPISIIGAKQNPEGTVL